MRRLIQILFFIFSLNAIGQNKSMTEEWQNHILANFNDFEYKDSLSQYNFGSVWTETDNSNVYGFIGENYKRIHIKIVEVVKENNPNSYKIRGKSMVGNNICQFQGEITINNLRVYKLLHWGVDNEYKNKGIKKQGLLIAKYHFVEDSTKKLSGVFEGILYTSWYINNSGELKYDNIEKESDAYRNNQFIGYWIDNSTGMKIICNWGDYRIPYSGDLDIGAGEFSPDDKYLPLGWQTYRDANFNQSKQARQIEEKDWWK